MILIGTILIVAFTIYLFMKKKMENRRIERQERIEDKKQQLIDLLHKKLEENNKAE
jgi:Tfp pilus assembly protein PilW